MILVGGQAVNVWAAAYLPKIHPPEFDGPLTSKDLDLFGDREAVKECARRLPQGKPIFEEPFARDTPIHTGVVEFVDHNGITRRIDILSHVAGVEEAAIKETAVRVAIGTGQIQVMHPVLCIFARGAVILELRRSDKHTLTQMRAAIICAKEYLRDLLTSDGYPRRVLDWNKKLFWYAHSGLGLDLFDAYGLDAFDAVLVDDRLPQKFLSMEYPKWCKRISFRRARRAKFKQSIGTGG